MITDTERIKIFKNTPRLLFFIFVVSFTNVYAAKLGRIEDLLGTSAPDASTNHLISFTTSSTIPVSGKIIITPESGNFNIPSDLDFEDIDLMDDGSNLTLAESAGSGAGSSVGVAVTTGTSGNIIFALNDTDAITASSTLTIKIGRNATSGAIGDKQIKNPATTGSYRINIETKNASSAILDKATTMVAIVSPVNVSAGKTAPLTPAPPPAPPPPTPAPGGGGGGPGPPPPTPAQGARVVLSGQTSPFAYISVLHDGRVVVSTFANSLGFFSVRLNGLPSGGATFTIFAKDRFNRNTLALQVNAFLINNTETVISDILLPPTIELANTVLRIPGRLVIRGETFPLVTLTVVIDPGGRTFFFKSNVEGYWGFEIPTFGFAPGIYTLKVSSKNELGRVSTNSSLHEFTLLPTGPVLCRGPDLNDDGFVNLVDLSITFNNWGSNPKNVCADLNGDKKVNLVDLSILLHHWSRRGAKIKE